MVDAFRGNAVVNTVRGAYERLQEVRRGLTPEPAEPNRLVVDPLAIASIEAAASEAVWN